MKQINYSIRKSLVERQTGMENRILQAFRSGEYTIKAPLIIVNPYGIVPQSALVLFRTKKPVAVTVTVCGKTADGTLTHTFPPACEHILPVLGLYDGMDNRVILREYQGAEHMSIIPIEPLPKEFHRVVSMETTRAYLGEDMIFLSPAIAHTGKNRLIAVDCCGDLRWCVNEPVSFAVKRLRNGNLMVGTERLERPIYYTTGLYEMTMCGKIVTE